MLCSTSQSGLREIVKSVVLIARIDVILIRGIGDPGVVNHATVHFLCELQALPMHRGMVVAAIISKNKIILYRTI